MDNNNLLHLVLNQSRVGIWDWNLITGIGKVNSTYKSILGYEDNEFTDETNYEKLGELIFQEDYLMAIDKLNNHIASNGKIPYDIELRYRHKSGTTVWVNSRANVVEWNDDGTAIRIVGSIVDITKQKEKEEAAIREKELLSAIINNIPQSIFWKDKDSVFQGCNKAFANSLGLENPEDVKGKSNFNLTNQTTEEIERYLKSDQEVLLNNLPKISYVEKGHHIDGSIFFAELSKVPLKDIKGETKGILGIYNDITEQKETQAQLIHTNNLYRILSHLNSNLLHTSTKEELYNDVCTIITQAGGIKLAWIGEVNNNSIITIAKAGSPLSYLQNLSITLDDSPTGWGPTARAVKENKNYICNDYFTDPNTIPWQNAVMEAGFKSAATFPIKQKNITIAVLTVYADSKNYFKEKEIALFEEIISAIFYGIERIKLAKQKSKADKRIKLLAEIIDNNQALVAIAKMSDKSLVYLNDAFKETLEIQKDEDISKLTIYDIRAPKLEGFIENTLMPEINKKGRWSGETQIISKSGKLIPLIQTISVFNDNSTDKPAFLTTTAINISELKEKESELHSLTNHLFTVREDERKNIAKEIHDELGQNLTGLKLGISWLQKHIENDKEKLLLKLDEIESIAADTVTATRSLYNSLYPQMLEEIGLLGAIRWHSKTYLSTNNIEVVIQTNLSEEKPIFAKDSNACLAVYRVYQECSTNILRYAQASKVTIQLNVEDGFLHLQIKDNGIGFEVDKVDTKLHHGLIGMKERIKSLKGTILLESVIGKGTSKTVKVPI